MEERRIKRARAMLREITERNYGEMEKRKKAECNSRGRCCFLFREINICSSFPSPVSPVLPLSPSLVGCRLPEEDKFHVGFNVVETVRGICTSRTFLDGDES